MLAIAAITCIKGCINRVKMKVTTYEIIII